MKTKQHIFERDIFVLSIKKCKQNLRDVTKRQICLELASRKIL